MTSVTKDSRLERINRLRKKLKEKNLEEVWDQVDSIKSPSDYLAHVAAFVLEHDRRDEIIETAEIFIQTFLTWQKVILGEKVSEDEFEAAMLDLSIALEIGNPWYKSVRPVLEPFIVDAKASFAVARAITKVGVKYEGAEPDMIWQQLSKMWEFIPWLIFVATGNMTSYIACKILTARTLFYWGQDFKGKL